MADHPESAAEPSAPELAATSVSSRSMSGGRRWRRRHKVLATIASVAAIAVLAPTLRDVYGELADLRQFDFRWLGVVVACEFFSFVCAWQLQRIVLRRRDWSTVARSQLAGNAVSQLLPAGGPAGAAVQAHLLVRSGLDVPNVVGGMTAYSILSNVGFLVLPLAAVPLLWTGSEIDSRVEAGIWAGIVLLVVAVVGVVVVSRDHVLNPLAAGAERAVAAVRRNAPQPRLQQRVRTERDRLQHALRRHWSAATAAMVGRIAADFAALVVALIAVGARPSFVAALTAFAVANVAGMIPLTPGGFGFVEAGLTGMLVLNGVAHDDALQATAVYRLCSTWLPAALGLLVVARTRLSG